MIIEELQLDNGVAWMPLAADADEVHRTCDSVAQKAAEIASSATTASDCAVVSMTKTANKRMAAAVVAGTKTAPGGSAIRLEYDSRLAPMAAIVAQRARAAHAQSERQIWANTRKFMQDCNISLEDAGFPVPDFPDE